MESLKSRQLSYWITGTEKCLSFNCGAQNLVLLPSLQAATWTGLQSLPCSSSSVAKDKWNNRDWSRGNRPGQGPGLWCLCAHWEQRKCNWNLLHGFPLLFSNPNIFFPSKLTAKRNWSKSILTWYDIMIYNNMANWLLYCKFIVLRSTASVGSVGDELWECLLWFVMRQSVIEPHQLTFLYFWQVRKILWPV